MIRCAPVRRPRRSPQDSTRHDSTRLDSTWLESTQFTLYRGIMVSLTAHAAVAALSILSLATTANAQLQQAVYQGCYDTSYPLDIGPKQNSSLTYKYQASGWCQQACGLYYQKAAFGLTKGSDCWCGDELPANSTKVDDSECDRPCQGYGYEDCGGDSTWSVYTSGLDTDVDTVSDAAASSAAAESAAATATTGTASQSKTEAPSTITQAGQTITVTPSSSSKSGSSSGPSKAGIAAGVVVGVIAIAGIAGGAFFYIRHQRRRAIEAEYQRQQAINDFKSVGGTMKSSSAGSTTDSRMDPSFNYRRQSDGSIADDVDFSRRILKVSTACEPQHPCDRSANHWHR